MAVTMGNAIKNRATNEEILAILKELPNPNQDDDDGQFPCFSSSSSSSLAALVFDVSDQRPASSFPSKGGG